MAHCGVDIIIYAFLFIFQIYIYTLKQKRTDDSIKGKDSPQKSHLGSGVGRAAAP